MIWRDQSLAAAEIGLPATALETRIRFQNEQISVVFCGGLHRRICLLPEKFSTKCLLIDLHLDLLVIYHDADCGRFQKTLGFIRGVV